MENLPEVYAEICSWDNLLLAYRLASKGKRGHPNVDAFEYRLEDNLIRLQAELQTRAYHPEIGRASCRERV